MGIAQNKEFSWEENNQYRMVQKNLNDGTVVLVKEGTNQEFIGRQLICKGKEEERDIRRLIEQKTNNNDASLNKLISYEQSEEIQYCYANKIFYLLFEKPGHTLRDQILSRKFSNNKMSEEEAFVILESGVKGLKHLKKLSQPHQNISTSSFFITKDREIILGDPWITPPYSYNFTSMNSTPLLHNISACPSPEKIQFQNDQILQYCPYRSDLFSLGMVILEVLNFEHMDILYEKGFRRVLEDKIIQKMQAVQNPELKNKLRILLAFEPRDRDIAFTWFRSPGSAFTESQARRRQLNQIKQQIKKSEVPPPHGVSLQSAHNYPKKQYADQSRPYYPPPQTQNHQYYRPNYPINGHNEQYKYGNNTSANANTSYQPSYRILGNQTSHQYSENKITNSPFFAINKPAPSFVPPVYTKDKLFAQNISPPVTINSYFNKNLSNQVKPHVFGANLNILNKDYSNNYAPSTFTLPKENTEFSVREPTSTYLNKQFLKGNQGFFGSNYYKPPEFRTGQIQDSLKNYEKNLGSYQEDEENIVLMSTDPMQHNQGHVQPKQTEFLNKVVESSVKKQQQNIEHLPIYEKNDREMEKNSNNIPFAESEIKKSGEEEENDVVLISSNYVLKEDKNQNRPLDIHDKTPVESMDMESKEQSIVLPRSNNLFPVNRRSQSQNSDRHILQTILKETQEKSKVTSSLPEQKLEQTPDRRPKKKYNSTIKQVSESSYEENSKESEILSHFGQNKSSGNNSSNPNASNNSDGIVEEELSTGFYKGQKKNGMRNGRGKFTYKEGSVYDGEWKDNMMNGQGTLYYPSGKIAYQGEWKMDQFHGQGAVYNQEQNSGEGNAQPMDYKNLDNINEHWVFYGGELYQDRRHGRGKLKFSNGQIFSGNFIRDRAEGEGKYYTLQGGVIHGVWQNNKLIRLL